MEAISLGSNGIDKNEFSAISKTNYQDDFCVYIIDIGFLFNRFYGGEQ